jgi:hypothetical protein
MNERSPYRPNWDTDSEETYKESVRRLAATLREFKFALDDVVDTRIFKLMDDGILYTELERVCAIVGHEWGPDQCGYLDHCFCYRCNKASTSDNFEELKAEFPTLKMAPVNRRYTGWKDFQIQNE